MRANTRKGFPVCWKYISRNAARRRCVPSGHLRAETTRTSRVWWSLHVYLGVRRRFRCCFTRRFRTGRPMARSWENTVDETIRRSAWVLRRKTKGNNIPACTCVLRRIHTSVRTNVYKTRCRRFTRSIRRRVSPPHPRFEQTFPNTMGRERRAATTPTRTIILYTLYGVQGDSRILPRHVFLHGRH